MLNRFRSIMGRTVAPIAPSQSKVDPVKPAQTESITDNYPKKYKNYHRSGPQLLITKILMINGPLQNKEIWRVYLRMLQENQKKGNPEKLDYFLSLTQLKRTLSFMRTNEKIKSFGYDRKKREHKGWEIQQKRALKFVHPSVIQEIEKIKSEKDIL